MANENFTPYFGTKSENLPNNVINGNIYYQELYNNLDNGFNLGQIVVDQNNQRYYMSTWADILVNPQDNSITEVSDLLEKIANSGVPIVNITSTDGKAYTGELPFDEENGKAIIAIPDKDMVVQTIEPELTLNGYKIKITVLRTGQAWYDASKVFIRKNVPILLMLVNNEPYEWRAIGIGVYQGNDLEGAVQIENGGTGAITAAEARTNLDVYSKSEVDNNATAIATTADLTPNSWTANSDGTYSQIITVSNLKCGKAGNVPPIITWSTNQDEYSKITSAEATAGTNGKIVFTISEKPTNTIGLIITDNR